MVKTIFALDNHEGIERYKSALKPKLKDDSYALRIFWSPYILYRAAKRASPGPDILIAAFELERYPDANGIQIVRRVHQSSHKTKFILCSGYDKSRFENGFYRLGEEGIDIKHVKLDDVERNLAGLVKSLIGE